MKCEEKSCNRTAERRFGPNSIKEAIILCKIQEKVVQLLKKDKNLFFFSGLQTGIT
jgi:hypothetical protein